MSLWKHLAKICSITPWTKKLALSAFYCWKSAKYRYQYAKKEQIEPQTVVFEAYMGKKYACSPKALYQAMLKNPEYASWKKIWAVREPEKYKFLEENSNTQVVAYRRSAYYQACARAKYWVTNSRMPRELYQKKGQEYIQCWHGTPLKKLGFDLEVYAEEKGNLKEVQENYAAEAKRVTHMPSPSPFYTEKMISAFHLDAYGKEQVLVEKGYPRNDELFLAKEEDIRRIRTELEIPEGKKVILYAPTWRETEHIPGEAYTYRLHVDFERWRQILGEQYLILFRTHYFISSQFDFSSLEGFVKNVSGFDDVNKLYLVSDALITDYSSVFFDFANLNRPILFYMYDFEKYKHEMRDFYLDMEVLPGPIVKKQDELLEYLKKLDDLEQQYKNVYQAFNERFNPRRSACSEEYLKLWF